MPISIDPAKLLGFRLITAEAEANGTPAGMAALGLKKGVKTGEKFGMKAGTKPT